MCRILEDMRNETRNATLRESAIDTAMRMIAAGKYAMEEIVNISGLSLDEVKKLLADRNA